APDRCVGGRVRLLRAARADGFRRTGLVRRDRRGIPEHRHAVWNHGLGEIVTAVFDARMELTGLVGHDSGPWQALPGQMEQITGGEWRLRDRPWRLPHSYTLQAVKRI